MILGVLSAARFESAGWPRFVTTGFHRNLSLLAVIFLALHIVTAVVDPYTNLGWAAAVIPFASTYRTLWLGLGTVAFDLLLAVLLTSLLRAFIGRHAWRAVHWLAYASWPVAVVHRFGTGTDSWSTWMLALDAVCCVARGRRRVALDARPDRGLHSRRRLGGRRPAAAAGRRQARRGTGGVPLIGQG